MKLIEKLNELSAIRPNVESSSVISPAKPKRPTKPERNCDSYEIEVDDNMVLQDLIEYMAKQSSCSIDFVIKNSRIECRNTWYDESSSFLVMHVYEPESHFNDRMGDYQLALQEYREGKKIYDEWLANNPDSVYNEAEEKKKKAAAKKRKEEEDFLLKEKKRIEERLNKLKSQN